MASQKKYLLVVPRIASYRAFLRELCLELNANGAEVHLACSEQAMHSEKSANALDSRLHFHSIDFARGMNAFEHLSAAAQLDELVSDLEPDLVDAHFSAAIFATALAHRKGWPVTLGMFHGLSFPLTAGIKGCLLRRAEAWAARRFDAIDVLTDDDRDALGVAAPRATVNVLRSFGIGCDLKHFSPNGKREMSRQRFWIQQADCVFTFVGRFTAFKGFDITVRSFLQIAEADPSLKLLLVGAPDPLHPSGLTQAEQQALKACPQIIDVGFQDDVAKYLAAADVMVFPSQREGMPVCVMEAMAMGVPVITRNSRGCRHVVRHERDGLVLEDCSVDSLAEAMKRLAQDPELRSRLSVEALAGRERFDRCAFVRERINTYHRALQVRKRQQIVKDCYAKAKPHRGLYAKAGKRVLDLALTVPALILLAPVLAIIALLVRFKLGSPVIFRQQRPGLNGKPFLMMKFRSMTDARGADGELLPDEQRITGFGKMLRRTSLDELPELINVLKGEMSLVGPRPLLVRYLSRYTPEQMRRHEALPGITGLAQVKGRNNLSWEEKFAHDVWYVDQRSLLLDLSIIAMTVRAVFSADGVSAPAHFSSPEFVGTENERIHAT